MRIYKVGGAVRDRLLGRKIKDCDWVVVGSNPEEMNQLGYRRVGKDFPVYLHPETHEEYALARTERKTGCGYYGFSVDFSTTITLEEDLSRRDLTINAIAETEDGSLIDPFNGQDDLHAGILRHISPAFVEDPLRVLRVARFSACLGFDVAPETNALMSEISTGEELLSIAAERVWSELERALCEIQPDLFIRTLRDCGALMVLFPEIDRLFGISQRGIHNSKKNTGECLCLALRRAAERKVGPTVIFAVLAKHIGEGTTTPNLSPTRVGSGDDTVSNFCDRFKVPKSHRKLALAVTKYHPQIHSARELAPKELLKLLLDLDALRRPKRLEEILVACEIDPLPKSGESIGAYPSTNYVREACEIVRTVDTRKLTDKNLNGEALRVALENARLAALTKSKLH
ncbi:MAG TPA: multifunctional CCA addition/repair protein [Gammaproteobacteria bacterium]|nr:multifunctional CCA addition/repair protein [Gammaproteobacteria bacterium]